MIISFVQKKKRKENGKIVAKFSERSFSLRFFFWKKEKKNAIVGKWTHAHRFRTKKNINFFARHSDILYLWYQFSRSEQHNVHCTSVCCYENTALCFVHSEYNVVVVVVRFFLPLFDLVLVLKLCIFVVAWCAIRFHRQRAKVLFKLVVSVFFFFFVFLANRHI